MTTLMLEVEDDPECTCECVGDFADANNCHAHNPDLQSRPLRLCSVCLTDNDEQEWPQIPRMEPASADVPLPKIHVWTAGGIA